MKKSLLVVFMLLSSIISNFAQDTIPNWDFEDWALGQMVEEPVSWGTASNLHIQINDCARKTTTPGEFYSGKAGIVLTTVTFDCPKCTSLKSWPIAGTAVSGGYISTSLPFVRGGFPYTKRPTDLNGFCKYLPQPVPDSTAGLMDKSDIQVYLFKYDKIKMKRDTIGRGQLSPNNSTFAPFSVNIEYDSKFPGNPDSAQIVLASSNGKAHMPDSSLFFVDGLFFDFTLGVESYTANNFDLKQNFPNPFTGNTTFQFNCITGEKVNFQICDLLGREMYSSKINAESGLNTINYSSKLCAGTYFYSLSNGKNKVSKKMVVTE
jgi:Secretion system C-terminal sorting domain/Putative carbohydrate metabolism domain